MHISILYIKLVPIVIIPHVHKTLNFKDKHRILRMSDMNMFTFIIKGIFIPLRFIVNI